MGFIAWIILGLAAGALARWFMPGDDKMSWLMTFILGVAGSFVGGFLASFIGMGGGAGFNLYSLISATIGAFILLFGYNKFVK